MKSHTILLSAGALLVASLLTLGSCSNTPEGDNATITEEKQPTSAVGTQYAADTLNSKIRFVGYGVGKNHPGNFKLRSGSVTVDNEKVSGGSFVIDIRSMEMEEKDAVFTEKLRPHLLSGDFFDAEKFNTATFEITAVEPYSRTAEDTSIVDGANFRVSGNLALKDVTKNISFPAHIDLDANTLKAKAKFTIDRTQWQMRYGNDKTLGDKFISEKVTVELDLKAVK